MPCCEFVLMLGGVSLYLEVRQRSDAAQVPGILTNAT